MQSVRFFRLLLIGAMAVAYFSFAVQPVGAQQLVDRVIASVGGEPITFLEVQRFLKSLGSPAVADGAVVREGTPEFTKALNELLVTRMLEREAEDAGISVGEDEIKAYMEEIKRQNSVDEDGLVTLLQSKGLTRDQYVAQIKGDIVKSRVVSARVRNQINVVDEDIERFVEEHPELRPNAGSLHLQQIKVPLSTGGSAEAARTKAKELSELLAEQQSVAAIENEEERQFLQDLGFVSLSDLRAEISEAVAGLNAGEETPVVEFANAAHVFRVVAKADDAGAVDTSTKERIRAQIFQRKFEERLKAFFDEELPKKYQLELVAAKKST